LLMFFASVVFQSTAQFAEKIPSDGKEVIKGPGEMLKNIAGDEILKKDSADAITLKSVGKYASANLIHYKMIDSMARVIMQYPLLDSAGLSYASDWAGTSNMGLRRPNYVIIHHTATNGHEEVIQDFTTPGGREASSHYVICKDGTVYHMLNDLLRSHHAGESKWGNSTDLNSCSVGIEIVNNGKQPFTDEQINSLTQLLARLKTAYRIPDANFLGHGDIAPTRKVDPHPEFPWKQLSEKGYGLWWDDTSNVEVPDNFDYLLGLRIIGYDISYPASAVAAFKRHFMQDGSGGGMNAAVRKIIYTLYRKFL
ncbi:MAG TPA: N-acetylmuramoyl-L-alanine amidase, partial [Chitinophagaceae bacterium]|nr:N-acetylmuramoyl-L-alanine amidase [Chitinophagaceae bacterium]